MTGQHGMLLPHAVEPEGAEITDDDTTRFAFRETRNEPESRKRDTQGNDPREIWRDSEMEKVIRSQTLLVAQQSCRHLYNRCKLSLRMLVFESSPTINGEPGHSMVRGTLFLSDLIVIITRTATTILHGERRR